MGPKKYLSGPSFLVLSFRKLMMSFQKSQHVSFPSYTTLELRYTICWERIAQQFGMFFGGIESVNKYILTWLKSFPLKS